VGRRHRRMRQFLPFGSQGGVAKGHQPVWTVCARALDSRTFGAREQGAPDLGAARHSPPPLSCTFAGDVASVGVPDGVANHVGDVQDHCRTKECVLAGEFLAVAQRRHEPAKLPWTAPVALQSGVRTSSFDSLHALVRLALGCVVRPDQLRQIVCRRRSSVVLLGLHRRAPMAKVGEVLVAVDSWINGYRLIMAY
jgi:hypothetical protein